MDKLNAKMLDEDLAALFSLGLHSLAQLSDVVLSISSEIRITGTALSLFSSLCRVAGVSGADEAGRWVVWGGGGWGIVT